MNLLGNSVTQRRRGAKGAKNTFDSGFRRAGGNTSHLRVARLRGCGPAGPLFFFFLAVCALVCGYEGESNAKAQRSKDAKKTDNYSFCVGVYCAERVLGLRATNHDEVLHQARIFSVTNGWPEFNNRDGFRGDEPQMKGKD